MASDLASALTEGPDGVLIDLEVTPGAREARFPDGLDPWRRRLRIRVRAPPEAGRANREVCALVAERLGVPPARVRLTKGPTSSHKTVHVSGLALHEAARLLHEADP